MSKKKPGILEKEYNAASFGIAIKMIKDFKYRPWMSNENVVDIDGSRINEEGNVYISSSYKKKKEESSLRFNRKKNVI